MKQWWHNGILPRFLPHRKSFTLIFFRVFQLCFVGEMIAGEALTLLWKHDKIGTFPLANKNSEVHIRKKGNKKSFSPSFFSREFCRKAREVNVMWFNFWNVFRLALSLYINQTQEFERTKAKKLYFFRARKY